MVWYFHHFQNFPQFIVIHTVKGFGIVNKAEIDVFFLELSCFFDDPADIGNLISGPSAFSKTSLNIWKFMAHVRGQGQKPGGLHPQREEAKRSYLESEVRGSGRECQVVTVQKWPRGDSPHSRSGAVAENARLRQLRRSQEELPDA